MAGCGLSREQIDQAVAFHGHWCPGLAIGLRAGEYVVNNLGRAADEEVVAIVETDMCAVDAIQSLTGCTFGKGNLRYQDHGKTAFSFFSRKQGRGFRLVFNSAALNQDPEFQRLNQKMLNGELTPEEEEKIKAMREERGRWIMEAPFEELFQIKEPTVPPPRPARILATLVCQECGEGVMESRSHLLAGRTLCRPCFEARDKWI